MEEDVIEYIKTQLMVKAMTLDRTSQDDVDTFNKLSAKYKEAMFGKPEKDKDKEPQDFKKFFDLKFKDKDGNVKLIQI